MIIIAIMALVVNSGLIALRARAGSRNHVFVFGCMAITIFFCVTLGVFGDAVSSTFMLIGGYFLMWAMEWFNYVDENPEGARFDDFLTRKGFTQISITFVLVAADQPNWSFAGA